jgi:hypothetical protein
MLCTRARREGERMSKWTFGIAAIGSIAPPGLALAHPGHGAEAGLLHYASDPFHLIGAVVLVASATLVGAWARRARSRSAAPDSRRR